MIYYFAIQPVTDLKRPASAVGSAVVPPPRGRIAPPNAAMINLVKSRDPRLARQQAHLVAQMTAARTNSTPTMVGGVQVPPQHPIALDPSSGKQLSIRERLGRIPKRTDPRIKAAQGTDADRKKPTSSTTTSTSSNSLSPSHRSRSEYDPTKKREKKDETTSKSGRSPSSKSSNSDKKKSSTEMSSPKSSSPLKKKASSLSEKSPSRGEKTSPKLREGKVSKGSKSATRRPGETSKASDDSSVSPSSSSENLMPVANESKDVDLRLLIPEKKLKLDQQPMPPQQQQAKLVSKPLPDQSKSELNLLPPLSTLSSSVQKQCIVAMLSLIIFRICGMIRLIVAFSDSVFLPLLLLSTVTPWKRDPWQLYLLSEKLKPRGHYCINDRHCLYDNTSMTTLGTRQQHKTRALNYLICCQINAVFDKRNRNQEGIWIKL